jgi:hypothetical protein
VMGGGAGAVAWQIGDVNGDRRAEVIQHWDNGGKLGMVVYGWSGDGMKTLWSSDSMGGGSRAAAWLIGDVNNDKRVEIVQQCNNGAQLGTVVYGWSGDAMKTMFRNDAMGVGPGAVAWQIGDINGDGRAEIIQQCDNGGRLGTIVHRWTSNTLKPMWSSNDLGQPSRAVQWLIGRFGAPNFDHIVQQRDNQGRLATVLYGFV